MELGPGAPTPPIALAGGAAAATSRRRGSHVGVTDAALAAKLVAFRARQTEAARAMALPQG